jgi:hypothetical protein
LAEIERSRDAAVLADDIAAELTAERDPILESLERERFEACDMPTGAHPGRRRDGSWEPLEPREAATAGTRVLAHCTQHSTHWQCQHSTLSTALLYAVVLGLGLGLGPAEIRFFLIRTRLGKNFPILLRQKNMGGVLGCHRVRGTFARSTESVEEGVARGAVSKCVDSQLEAWLEAGVEGATVCRLLQQAAASRSGRAARRRQESSAQSSQYEYEYDTVVLVRIPIGSSACRGQAPPG